MRVIEQILVFGEDDHDRSAISVLIDGLRPDLRGRTRIVKRRAPLALVKNMDRARQRSKAGRVLAAIRAEARALPVRACVFHEDTDAVEPAHTVLIDDIQQQYGEAPGLTVPAVAAWEVEAWWYLFPAAVGAVRQTWRPPVDYTGRDVGKIISPKEKLAAHVRPAGLSRRAAFRGYEEADSVEIAKSIVNGGHLQTPVGISQSWAAFVAAVAQI